MDSLARIEGEHLVLCVNHLLRKLSKQPDGVCVGGEGFACLSSGDAASKLAQIVIKVCGI